MLKLDVQGEGKAYGVELLLQENRNRLNGWVGYTLFEITSKLDGQFNEEKKNKQRKLCFRNFLISLMTLVLF